MVLDMAVVEMEVIKAVIPVAAEVDIKEVVKVEVMAEVEEEEVIKILIAVVAVAEEEEAVAIEVEQENSILLGTFLLFISLNLLLIKI